MVVTWGNTTVFGSGSSSTVPTTPSSATAGASSSLFGTPANANSTTGSTSNAFSFGAATAPSTNTNTGSTLLGALPSLSTSNVNSNASSTSLFGNTGFSNAPSPGGGTSGGGLFGFGTTSTPSSSGGLFGNSNSAGGGSLFGATTPTTPTSSLFGGGSGGLFGTTTTNSSWPGSINNNPAQQQQQPAILIDDVNHLLLSNHMKREEIRITNAMKHLFESYQGTEHAVEQQRNDTEAALSRSAPFTTVLYNPATSQQRQIIMSTMTSSSTDTNKMTLPSLLLGNNSNLYSKPYQICEREWHDSIIRNNPDINLFAPIGIIGADSLSARVLYQQQQCNDIEKHLKALQLSYQTILANYQQSYNILHNGIIPKHEQHRIRLLVLMKKVELLRCMNQPLQRGEYDAITKLQALYQYLNSNIEPQLSQLQNVVTTKKSPLLLTTNGTMIPKKTTSTNAMVPWSSTHEDNKIVTIDQILKPTITLDEHQLKDVIQQHRHQLREMTLSMKKDLHDVQLILQRFKLLSQQKRK